MHGYQLLNELAELFGSRYRPSPGTVYPAIDALESERLVRADHSQPRVVYRLTASGKEILADRAYVLTRLAHRTGVSLPAAGQFTTALEDFASRLSRLEGHIDAVTVTERLTHLAEELEKLAGTQSEEHHVRPI